MSIRRKKMTQKGQAMLGIVLFFLFISSTIAFGISRAVYHQLRSALDFGQSRASYFLAEALAEDTAYQLINGFALSANPSLSLDGNTASALVVDVAGRKEITSVGEWANLFRSVKLTVTYGTGGSFFYGIQVGEGGLIMYNTSSVSGNVHSAGTIVGTGVGTGSVIRGDVISAGPGGLIDGVYATSSAYAHIIRNSTVDKDAYYVELTDTDVGGVLYPGSPDQSPTPLPISDAQIDAWKTDAASGGSFSCTDGKYTIDSNITLGPKKIPCDLDILGNTTRVTLTGALWVVGDINVENNTTIRISPVFTDVTIPIIADNVTDRANSSRIILKNSAVFEGSGTNSYVLLVSRNNSAESGGAVKAIEQLNYVAGEVLLYAPHGEIELQNAVNLREVTAYKLTLRNSAEVIYKTGLANVLFRSGPSGGFSIVDWREVE